MTTQKMSRVEVIEECARECDRIADEYEAESNGTSAFVVACVAKHLRALASQAAAPAEPKRDYCPEKLKPGGCQLPNVHCGYPECNKPPAAAPAEGREALTENKPQVSDIVDELQMEGDLSSVEGHAPLLHRAAAEITRLRAARGEPVAWALTNDGEVMDLFRNPQAAAKEAYELGGSPWSTAPLYLAALAARGEPVAWWTMLDLGPQGHGPVFTTNREMADKWRAAGPVTPLYGAPQPAALPREPTPEMLRVGAGHFDILDQEDAAASALMCWRDMHDAAPQAVPAADERDARLWKIAEPLVRTFIGIVAAWDGPMPPPLIDFVAPIRDALASPPSDKP